MIEPVSKDLPEGLSLEKPAKNLASLATTPALRALTATVLAQWKHNAAFSALARHGIRPIDRMLFYGPPGNGKTLSCQWLASQIDAPLYRVRCEALVSSYLGQTAGTTSQVMQWLARQPGRVVVLLDEVETIFASRQEMTGKIGRELNSAMGVFWQYLDRWEAPTLFVLATNMRERLDAALLSRIDLQLEFGPPTAEQAASVIRYWQEVLHEYGSDKWAPVLLGQADQFPSFRFLFQEIQHRVRGHVTGTC